MTVTMLSGHSQPLALHPDSSLWAVVLALLTEVGLQLGEGPQASPTRSPEGKRLSDTGPSARYPPRAEPCPAVLGSLGALLQTVRHPGGLALAPLTSSWTTDGPAVSRSPQRSVCLRPDRT